MSAEHSLITRERIACIQFKYLSVMVDQSEPDVSFELMELNR
jgi:hypothetical protein